MYCVAIHNTGPHEEWAHRLTPGGCKALGWLARNAVLASVPVRSNADEASAETAPADTLAANPKRVKMQCTAPRAFGSAHTTVMKSTCEAGCRLLGCDKLLFASEYNLLILP